MALKLISSLYAILMILWALMFSTSEALKHSYLETYYNGVFLTYMYVMATAFLLLLQLYIIPASNKKHQRLHDVVTASNINTPPVLPELDYKIGTRSGRQQGDTTLKQTLDRLPQKESLFNNKDRPTDEVVGGASAGSDTESCNDEFPADGVRSRVNTMSSMKKAHSRVRHNTAASSVTFQVASDNPAMDTGQHGKGEDEQEQREGSSFYLRLGILVFGIANMIYILLEIDYRMINVPDGCLADRFGWTFILELVFIIIQTFFLFKNPMVHITLYKKVYDFGCKHLLATNLCVWIRTLVSEIEEAFHHSSHEAENSKTVSGLQTLINTTEKINDSCVDYGSLINSARPYLFPFVLEYSLIATGILVVMTQGVHHLTVVKSSHYHNLYHGNQQNNSPTSHAFSSSIEDKLSEADQLSLAESRSIYSHFGPMQVKKRGTVNLNMKNSHKGLFIGILVLAGSLVAIILFFYEANAGDTDSAQMNYLVSDIVLHAIMLTAILYSLYALRKLKMRDAIHIQVDDILLFIAMSGSVVFETSIIISCSVYLSDYLYKNMTFTVLALDSAVISVLQTILQTVLITNGLRRHTNSIKQHEDLPGREAITFLIVCNVTVWIFRTFQVKELQMGIQEEFYGTLAWLFILNLNLPLLLFFHFHSSVCLADIWIEAYQYNPEEFGTGEGWEDEKRNYGNAAGVASLRNESTVVGQSNSAFEIGGEKSDRDCNGVINQASTVRETEDVTRM